MTSEPTMEAQVSRVMTLRTVGVERPCGSVGRVECGEDERSHQRAHQRPLHTSHKLLMQQLSGKSNTINPPTHTCVLSIPHTCSVIMLAIWITGSILASGK